MERATELNLDAEIKSFDEGELERWLEALEPMRQRANWARTHRKRLLRIAVSTVNRVL